MAVVTLGTGFPPLLWTGLCLCLCLSLAHSIPPTGSSQPLERMHNARPHGGLLTLQRMRGHPEGQGPRPQVLLTHSNGHLSRTYCAPGTALNPLQQLSDLIPTTTQRHVVLFPHVLQMKK